MDPATALSDDDDYYLVSSSGHQSLDSSVADISRAVFEPPPTSGAQTKFETARFTAEEIQTYVRRALDASSSRPHAGERPQLFADNKTIRVYVDGTFDIFNVGFVSTWPPCFGIG